MAAAVGARAGAAGRARCAAAGVARGRRRRGRGGADCGAGEAGDGEGGSRAAGRGGRWLGELLRGGARGGVFVRCVIYTGDWAAELVISWASVNYYGRLAFTWVPL